MSGFLPSAQFVEVGDAAANTSTSYTMSVGDTFSGAVSGSGDVDWVRVNLVAGQTYVFTVWGTGGETAGLDDTILSLYNSSGTLISVNDDVQPAVGNLFSQITYTPTTSGTYYLGAAAFGSETGTYTLQAATNVYTLDQVVTQLTDFGWGIPVPIAHDERTGDTMTVNLTALTAAGQQLATWALEAWTVATGITFVQGTTGADIIFDDNQSGAFAGPTSYSPITGTIFQASVNVSTNWLASYGTTLDSYSFLTYLHEIGHALGLVHAGAYNGTASFPSSATFLNDSYQMTVMSYFSVADNTYISGTDASPVTPMIADIAAVEYLYGTTAAAHAGDTTWGANSNVGGYLGTLFGYLFDGVTRNPSVYGGGPVSLTVHDSSGSDTIDLSTTTAANRVDLAEEAISDVAGLFGNMVIARGTVIENLLSGSGNDTLSGNAVANRIEAGSGHDVVRGFDGNDRLDGEDGNDTIMGGIGNDAILGRAGNDLLYGENGNDNIAASDGNDTVYGG
ncbi:M10 family metallopeptidase C-terminal domain-containing protein, partial [Defluviimonas aestuarii]|uniref:M10 family metallopeptidase C-terminal domain-containing protein n=1 Tax=Albidovulum aestuarii TaxID=1130726 RepID=UPI00249A8950